MRSFCNSPEYNDRCQTPFVTPSFTLKELRDALPEKVFRKSTAKGIYYVLRTCIIGALLCWVASHIEHVSLALRLDTLGALLFRWLCWFVYWFFQSLIGGGLWTLGHEAGHGTLSPHQWVNHVLGFLVHTILMVPYFSWRWTHRMHHKGSASLDKDENYVPQTRNDFKWSDAGASHKFSYHEALEDTPIYAAGRLLFMTLLGFQTYMICNALGNPKYPKGTNHLNPFSPLFPRGHWLLIFASDLAVGLMASLLVVWGNNWGFSSVVKYYFIPYLFANHWVVILTFLQHTDPTIPHYRKGEWNFVRGSLATVDRPLLGWAGRFFLHNIAHDHTAHHLFSNVPFYNLPTVTRHIKPILKKHYSYDSTYTFYALWRSFNQCIFVENEGDILFYKNKHGNAMRGLAETVSQ